MKAAGREVLYILCVDDDLEFLKSLELFLPASLNKADNAGTYYRCFFLGGPMEAIAMVEELVSAGEMVAMVISDQKMPRLTGTEMMVRISEVCPGAIRVLLTGHAGIASAIEAINSQLLDKYLTKPIEDQHHFLLSIEHLLQRFQMRQVIDEQNRALRSLYEFSNQLNRTEGFGETLGRVLDFTRSELECEEVTIRVRDENALQLLAREGVSPETIETYRCPDMSPYRALGSAGAFLVAAPEEPASEPAKFLYEPPFIGAVLGAREETLGIILAKASGVRGPANHRRIAVLTYIANVASIAIQNQLRRICLEAALQETRSQAAELEGINRRLRVLIEEKERLNVEERRHVAELEREMDERRKAEEALHRSEEELRQAHKMQAVGQLAGGVAHDFNNLLTAVLGHCDLALRAQHTEDVLTAHLRHIRKAGENAAKLTQQLLIMSRKKALETRNVNLNVVVSDLDAMLNRIIGENVKVVTCLQANLAELLADQANLQQMVLNLVMNARDAMPEGGTIRIETRNVVLGESGIPVPAGLAPGPYVEVTVTDDGCGMSRETLERIFEPFFTTKELGKGTGLGLSTVYAVVDQLKGHVSVASEVGKGTKFTIHLPALASAPARQEVPVPEIASPAGCETVLVAEDEPMVRSLVEAILLSQGYRVLLAENGEEASRLAAAHSGEIHLMLTDIMMPGMNGREAYERVSLERPAMKVVFMSGYTDGVIREYGLPGGETSFIPKPFGPEALLACIRAALDGEQLAA